MASALGINEVFSQTRPPLILQEENQTIQQGGTHTSWAVNIDLRGKKWNTIEYSIKKQGCFGKNQQGFIAARASFSSRIYALHAEGPGFKISILKRAGDNQWKRPQKELVRCWYQPE